MLDFRLPRRFDAIAAACERAEALVRDAGWPAGDLTRVALAVGEAVGNAVEHGGRPGADQIRVQLALEGETLTVRVADGGDGPDREQLAQAHLPEASLATSGRGLYILQQVADSVRVDDDGVLCLTIRSTP